jgi:hypothetical protein
MYSRCLTCWPGVVLGAGNKNLNIKMRWQGSKWLLPEKRCSGSSCLPRVILTTDASLVRRAENKRADIVLKQFGVYQFLPSLDLIGKHSLESQEIYFPSGAVSC